MIRKARILASANLRTQWVPGDTKKAERSFFTINDQATPIEKTERQMIEARHQPIALATRAIIRAGTGHKYWSTFAEGKRGEIEKLARETYSTLFTPDLETPIKTLDLPVAGRGYSGESVKLIWDLVAFANRERVGGAKGKTRARRTGPQDISSDETGDDKTGDETIAYLKTARRLASMVAGTSPASLGVHPAVYFYSATGRYQPTAFLAAVSFVDHLEQT